MTDSSKEIERQLAKQFASESLRQGDPAGWFEPLYASLQPDRVPWALMTVNPYLADWLDGYQPSAEGRSALTIGCGLGDDAEALQKRGFQVSAFDISPTAIAQCQQRFPESQVNYFVADLLALDPSMQGQFDLVVESRTIQALPLNVRSQVMGAIAPLVAKAGTLLIITYFRDTEAEPEGPPWPLSNSELAQFQSLGLTEVRRDLLTKEDNPLIKILRVEYKA